MDIQKLAEYIALHWYLCKNKKTYPDVLSWLENLIVSHDSVTALPPVCKTVQECYDGVPPPRTLSQAFNEAIQSGLLQNVLYDYDKCRFYTQHLILPPAHIRSWPTQSAVSRRVFSAWVNLVAREMPKEYVLRNALFGMMHGAQLLLFKHVDTALSAHRRDEPGKIIRSVDDLNLDLYKECVKRQPKGMIRYVSKAIDVYNCILNPQHNVWLGDEVLRQFPEINAARRD